MNQLKLRNKLFELKSEYGDDVLSMARISISAYVGPMKDKYYFSRWFRAICYGIQKYYEYSKK